MSTKIPSRTPWPPMLIGRLVTQIATDTKPDIELKAFRPDRWQ